MDTAWCFRQLCFVLSFIVSNNNSVSHRKRNKRKKSGVVYNCYKYPKVFKCYVEKTQKYRYLVPMP